MTPRYSTVYQRQMSGTVLMDLGPGWSVLQIESETPKDVEGRHETAYGCDDDQQTRIARLDSVSAAPIESRQQKAEHHHAESAEDQDKSHVIFGVVRAGRASFQEYCGLMGFALLHRN